MMIYTHHWLLVLLAAVVNFFLGWFWYSVAFKKPWMELMGHMPGQMDAAQMKTSMMQGMIINFIGALFSAFVFFTLAANLLVATLGAGFGLAFWLWLGFMCPILVSDVLWGGKKWKLFWINAAFWLCTLIVTSLAYHFWA